jgi:hypothetical protein
MTARAQQIAARPDFGERPLLAWLPVAQLVVDHNYQRDLRDRHVKKLARAFRWAKCSPLIVAPLPANGQGPRYAVTDGQHCLAAARLADPAVAEMPCYIVAAPSVAEQAALFLAINGERLAVTPVERYWAGLAAGDGRTVALARVLTAAGVEIVPARGYMRPGMTQAVSTLFRMVDRHGAATVTRALTARRMAWPSHPRALGEPWIAAVTRALAAAGGGAKALARAAELPALLAELDPDKAYAAALRQGRSELKSGAAVLLEILLKRLEK